MLLPPSLDELIAQNHPVRIVNKVLDQIDIEPLIAKSKAGGTSSFHPTMLLKVLVFAYINNIYSSRKIEEALKQNIHFMWLSAMNTPKDFREKAETVITDAGYGSEENYQWLEDNNITAYVKHNQFGRQQNETIRDKKPFSTDKLSYNKEKDCYYCPMGQAMNNIGTTIRTTTTDFKQPINRYQAKNCEGCPLRGACHKAKGNRTIEINYNLNRLKQTNCF